MDSSIRNQVAIVTGGASGIGFAVAEKLHSLGVRLAILDLDPDRLSEAKERLNGEPLTVQVDVSDEASVNAAVAEVKGRYGQIDLLLNSVGITINALAPAVINTAMHDAMPQEQIEYMTAKIPMSRCGTLDEAVAMITYILSPEKSFTTGFCFDLSGGRATY